MSRKLIVIGREIIAHLLLAELHQKSHHEQNLLINIHDMSTKTIDELDPFFCYLI